MIMECIICGNWFSSIDEGQKLCMTCERVLGHPSIGIAPERLLELAQAEHDGRLVVLPPNDPLTLEELKEMVGEPVYIVTYEKAEWCILHSYHSSEIVGGGFIMTRRTAEKRAFPYADYGKTWLAYRRKPEAATPKASPDWCDHIKKRFEKVT